MLSYADNFALKFLVVVAAYYVAARAGIYLHIPSGQASIIWPASGVAMGAVYVLGYRYAPAVLCGAFLSSLYFYDVIDLQAISIAACIAFGAALQASFGAFLIGKWLHRSTTLENINDIGLLMLIGGPVACCVNASLATFTLYIAGIVEADLFVSHAYSWWLGDVFGVLVFMPLVVLNFSETGLRKKLSLKRRLLVSIPTVIVFSIFLILFFNSKNTFQDRAYRSFEVQVTSLVDEFRKDLAVDLSSLIAIKSFFNASEFVSNQEFKEFTFRLLMESHGMFGVSWLPKVYHSDRGTFERSIQAQGYADFSIKSRTGKGSLEPSSQRPVYFPLAYTEPYEQNKRAHGFDVYGIDLLSGDLRRAILDDARDTGYQKATERFPIVQKEDQYGFIVYEPVYKTSSMYETVEERRAHHIGYINGIFIFPQLMQSINQKTKELGYDVVLQEREVSNTNVLFDSRTENYKENAEQTYVFDDVVSVSKVIDIAGRGWEITILKNGHLLSKTYVQELWFFVTGGVLFCTLLNVLLMIITARTEVVEKLVEQKTSDLQQVNAELEEFAYRTSHDLRSPLISSIGLLDLMPGLIQAGQYDKAAEGIYHVRSSLKKLELLVQDILALAQLKEAEEDVVAIDFEELVSEALDKFQHMENFDRLEIHTDFKRDLKVQALKSRVRLIVENLISNSIKYQDTDKQNSYIKITTHKRHGHVVFKVEDNGLGIPKEKQEVLFQMFARFHPQVAYGSGLGLYMMKKSADILNAEIIFKDIKGGTSFQLVF